MADNVVEIDAATIPKRGKKWRARIKKQPNTVDRSAAGFMVDVAIHTTELNQHMLDAKWRMLRGETPPMQSALWAMQRLLPKLKQDLNMVLNSLRYRDEN
jgi:hypothetical protein